MSIRTLNKLLTQPSCVVIMTVGLMLTMIIGFAGMRGCDGAPQPGDEHSAPDVIVAKVGSYPVSEQSLESLSDNLIAQHTRGRAASAEDMFSAYAASIVSQVADGMNALVAQKENVTITDKDILTAEQSQLDMGLMEMKMDNGLKTDDDLSKYIQEKSPGHLTLDGFKKMQLDQFQADLKDPVKRASIAATTAPQVVKEILAAHSTPSDDVLKASFVNITAQRILFKGDDITKQVADEEAERKKGATFEAMMDKYSKADTTKGKKEQDMTVVLTQFQLLNPAYAPLLKLKVGDVSDPLLTPEGTVIYKIQKVDHNVPKDFDKNKKAEGSQYAEQIADIKYQADLDDVKKTVAITWLSTGWKAAYEYENQLMSPTMTTAEKTKAIESALADSKQAVTDKTDTVANKVAGLTMYITVRDLIKDAGKDGPTKYGEDHIAAIKNIEDTAATPALFIELADAYSTAKDAAGVADALNEAATMNTNYDATGEQVNKDVANALAADGATLTAAQKQPIIDAIAGWTKTKAEQDKALAEQRKEDEDNQAAQKKEFEKAQQDAKKSGAAPTTGSKPLTVSPPTSGPPTPPAKKP